MNKNSKKNIFCLFGLGAILFIVIAALLIQLNGKSKDVVENVEGLSGQKKVSVGYIPYYPGFIVDPNSQEMSGIFYDILQEIGKRNNISFDFNEEVTWSTLVEVLETEKVDMIGSPVWVTPERRALASFSLPLYHSPIGAYARVDDQRLQKKQDIQDPAIKIVGVDGEGGITIAKEQFPKAQLISLPNSIDLSQLLLEVEHKNADVTFMEPLFAYEYMEKNPGILKNIAQKDPVQSRANSYMFQKGDFDIQAVINQSLIAMESDGTLKKIIDEYQPFSGSVIYTNYYQ